MTSEADIIFVDGGQFAFQVFAQQAHQKIDFGLRAAPVFQREGVEGEARELQACAGFDDFAGGFHSGAMAGDARQMALLRPAAVAVHDDGDVLRQMFQVEFIEKGGFVLIGGL